MLVDHLTFTNYDMVLFTNQNPDFIRLLMKNLAILGCKHKFQADSMKMLSSFKPKDYPEGFPAKFGFSTENLSKIGFAEMLESALEETYLAIH